MHPQLSGLEHLVSAQKVGGSSPSGCTKNQQNINKTTQKIDKKFDKNLFFLNTEVNVLKNKMLSKSSKIFKQNHNLKNLTKSKQNFYKYRKVFFQI